MTTANEWTSDCGTVRLICGDCLEVLPTLGKVDAVVTDPPYGIGVNHNMGRRSGDLKSSYDSVKWDDEPVSRECLDVIFANSEKQIIWGANHYANYISRPSPCWLVWDKLFSNDVSFAACELAWTNLSQTVKRFSCSSQRKNGLHPTQKPIELIEWCLGFLPDSETILDPFMGSGTTGVACVRTGRKFIGIEREPRYFEIAKRRISDELNRFPLLESQPQPVQQTLLEGGAA